MIDGHGSYCTACGSPLRGDQSFCAACGAALRQSASTVASDYPPDSSWAAPSRTAAAASRAYGAVAQVAGLAGMGFALPWQRLAGAQLPDIGSLLSAAAVPGAQRALRASLKRPGLALAATTILDLAVAAITGGADALYLALPRLVLALGTSALSLATGSKGGGMRKATGLLGAATAVAQFGFAVYTLAARLDDGTSGWVIVPQVVAMASALVMAAKTSTLALRRAR